VAGYIRAGSGCPPGSSPFPRPRVSLRRRLSSAAAGDPAVPSAFPRRSWVSSTSGGLSPSRFCNGCGYFSHLLTLGCDFTLALSWCLALSLLFLAVMNLVVCYSSPIYRICVLQQAFGKFSRGADNPAPWPDNPAWHVSSNFFLSCCHQFDSLCEVCPFIQHDS
jgi:hypothetical protein